MKINAIKGICKKGKKVRILTCAENDWIGVDNAIYCAESMRLTPAGVQTMFDMDEDAMGKLDVTHEELENTDLQPDPIATHMNEQNALMEHHTISWYGDKIRILTHENRYMYLIDESLIRAARSDEGYTRYYLAHTEDGKPLIILTNGIFMTAIIKPIDINGAEHARKFFELMGRMIPMGTTRYRDEGALDGQIRMEEMENKD